MLAGRIWYEGNTSDPDDGRSEGRKLDFIFVVRCNGMEDDGESKWRRDRLYVSGCACCKDWRGSLHKLGSARAHGVPKYRLAVSDVDHLQSRSWNLRDTFGVGDGGRNRRQLK